MKKTDITRYDLPELSYLVSLAQKPVTGCDFGLVFFVDDRWLHICPGPGLSNGDYYRHWVG